MLNTRRVLWGQRRNCSSHKLRATRDYVSFTPIAGRVDASLPLLHTEGLAAATDTARIPTTNMNDIDVQHLKEGEVNLGTSIMAVAYDGGVVLGADSRTTMGPYIANRVTDKLTHITDRIYCCRSGSAADTQAVADMVAYYLSVYSVEHGQPPVRTAASLFQEIVYQNKDALSASIIIAGWDPKKGGSVFNVPLGGGLFEQPWAIGGSGSSYIYGFCDSNWKPGMTKEETLEFVKNG